MFNYGKQFISTKDKSEVLKSLNEELLTTGRYVSNFERNFSKKLGCNFSLSCNSGTAGIHLALMTINLKKGDNVLIPSINFVAAASICKLMGANIYFVDVNETSFQSDYECFKNTIKQNKLKKIKAIFLMHLGGFPAIDIKDILLLKKKYNCIIIEDACHALGAKYKLNKKKFVGNCDYSDFSIFSLHPVKSITAGEGGVVCTNSKSYYEKIKTFRSHGITKKNKFRYEIYNNSLNYRLSDINCALALSQLRSLNKFIIKRRKIAKRYFKNFEKLIKNEIIDIINYKFHKHSAWHLLILKINFNKLKISYENLYDQLKKKGIITQLHYIPTYKFSAFKKLSNPIIKLNKNSEFYFKNCISIPIFYNLSLIDVDYISKQISLIFFRNLK